MSKTFKDLQDIDQVVGALYQKFPTIKETKFGYAYKRYVDKNYAPLVRDFNEELSALRVDHALEDPNTKEVLIDRMNPRGYKYNKANLKQLMYDEKKLAEKWDAKEVEVKPFISVFVPDELSAEDVELLRGVVIDETYVKTDKEPASQSEK